MKKIVSLYFGNGNYAFSVCSGKSSRKGARTYRDYEEFEYVDSFGEKV